MLLGTEAMELWQKTYANSVVYPESLLKEKTVTVDEKGISEVPGQMGKFLILAANSQEETAKIFLNHPHFHYFPGDSVQVLELVENRH